MTRVLLKARVKSSEFIVNNCSYSLHSTLFEYRIIGNMDKVLSELYHQPHRPNSLRGIKALYQAVKDKFGGRSPYKMKQIRSWLQDVRAWAVHKNPSVHHRKVYRKVEVWSAHSVWAVDLMVLNQIKAENSFVSYLLIVIDTFTRYLFVRPLKTKRGQEVADAMIDILREANVIPDLLVFDRGTEFYNKQVASVLKRNKIKWFSTSSPKKVPQVESVIRTLRQLLARLAISKNSNRYIDDLEAIVSSYNLSTHSSTKATPKSLLDAATNAEPAHLQEDVHIPAYPGVVVNVSHSYDSPLNLSAYQNVFGRHRAEHFKPRTTTLKPGDYVRVATQRTTFAKLEAGKFSDEYFRIASVIPARRFSPVMFKLVEYDPKTKTYTAPVTGLWYSWELSPCTLPEHFLVDKILKRRKIRGRNQVLVRWLGHSSKADSWEWEDDVIDA